MKWLFGVLIIFHVQASCEQTRHDSIRRIVNSINVGINTKELREKEIAAYADSIDRYTGGELPNFLYDLCLDWKASYWPDMHTAISVRWLILGKVNNKGALKLILNSGIPQLKLRPAYRRYSVSLPGSSNDKKIALSAHQKTIPANVATSHPQ